MILAWLVTAGATSAARPSRGAAACYSGHGSSRDGANPLDLSAPPGSNPLHGADLFVDGPAHGLAAGAIVRLLGHDPASYGNTTYGALAKSLDSGPLSAELRRSPRAAHRVNLLRKIAERPETKWFSVFSGGGGPGAIYSQARMLLCRMQALDSSAVPLLMTYMLNHEGYCPTAREDKPTFRRRIDELAAALGNSPFVLFAEMDAIDSAGCLSPAGLRDRIEMLKYEVDVMSRLPHGVVYIEGGTEDSNTPGFAARILNRVDIGKVRGFFLNETHYQWTSTEIRYGGRVSKLTHGAHFVVDTRANGNGPKLNPNPVTQGTENLCNPPGRGLGPPPTTSTGARSVDAYEWISTPGRSSGRCHPGDPAPGLFGADLAIGLAAKADARVGPTYHSVRY